MLAVCSSSVDMSFKTHSCSDHVSACRCCRYEMILQLEVHSATVNYTGAYVLCRKEEYSIISAAVTRSNTPDTCASCATCAPRGPRGLPSTMLHDKIGPICTPTSQFPDTQCDAKMHGRPPNTVKATHTIDTFTSAALVRCQRGHPANQGLSISATVT